jgi:trimethylamine--corrinoid protein Co-methyltransferase
MAEMLALFRRDQADLVERPLSVFTVTPSGNFRYGADSCQNLLDCAQWGIPIEIVPVTLMGLIAPVTLVGATVFHVVDVLAGLTMAQLIRPGLPVLFGGAPAAFHMREATSAMMAVEALRLDVAYAAVARALGLPIQAYMAFGDGKALDAQAGAETFGSALLAVLAGVDAVSGPGMLDYQKTFSLSKLVFDDEVCGQALFFGREVQEVDDVPSAELVATLLDEGHLLTAEHTLRHWTQHLHLPGAVYDRQSWDRWELAGRPGLEERARAEVERRLAAYVPEELDPRLDAEMRRLIRDGQTDDRALPGLPPH